MRSRLGLVRSYTRELGINLEYTYMLGVNCFILAGEDEWSWRGYFEVTTLGYVKDLLRM